MQNRQGTSLFGNEHDTKSGTSNTPNYMKKKVEAEGKAELLFYNRFVASDVVAILFVEHHGYTYECEGNRGLFYFLDT